MTDLEIAAQIFNRLLPVVRQTDRRVYITETLCGCLNAAGYAVNIDDCNLIVDVLAMPDGLTAEGLAAALDSLGVRPFAMTAEVTK